jgi:hypothetical protein
MIDLPTLNWFVHVLANNIGSVEYIPKEVTSKDEYPFAIIKHPIPDGNDIILENGKYEIRCNNEHVKDVILELAKKYMSLENEYNRLLQEKRADCWRLASDIPDGPLSSCKARKVLVTSPILRYVMPNGVCFGHENNGWYILIDGKAIKHNISHWRYLPPGIDDPQPYENIKEKVESLKKAINEDF